MISPMPMCHSQEGRSANGCSQEGSWSRYCSSASMRSPEQGQELASLERVLVTRLDVTDEGSMADALSVALERFGGIDVLINDGGFGAYGPLEVTATEVIRRQFNTNVIGLLTVSKAVMPILRQRGGGVIVNISLIGGRMTFPLGSTYHGSQ
jgi:NADP-dependent 3-hydroxy acid dehydrogenase YdfG